ncbi:MAG: tetraacyldisaccharide 4'-kinase [Paracoccaceae bacterium]
MRPPAFWYASSDRPSPLARLLAPAAFVWRLGGWIRATRRTPWCAPVPVLSIGNLSLGGTGKTPLAAAIAERAAARGLRPAILSRGHGGRLTGPVAVDPTRHTAAEVGDEPLLLAARVPVFVARDRAAAARAAVGAGADLLILDDGHQNPALRKDAAIVVVDAETGFGNGRVVPAGPLREPVSDGLMRADLTVIVGAAERRAAARARWPALAARPSVGADLLPVPTGLDLGGQRVVAFAGIGRPAKFFATLRTLGAVVVAAEAFDDHYAYPTAVLRRLVTRAEAADALLVTTEKDAVRLPAAFRSEVLTVPVRLVPEDWSLLDELLARLTSEAGSHPT